MKKWLLLPLLLSATIACQKRNQNIAEKIKVESQDAIKNNQAKLDEVKKQQEEIEKLKVGGAPATLYFSKNLTQENNKKEVGPIEAIKVSLLGGVGKNGKRVNVDMVSKITIDQSQAPAQNEAANLGTYISLGCDNLNPADTGTLKPTKLEFSADKERGKDFLTIMAKKIFICGTAKAAHSLIYVSAEEVILKDATVQLSDNLINFAVRAKIITLRGKSKLQHKGHTVSLMSRRDDAKISIIADEKIFGDGSLEIISEGGQYVDSRSERQTPTQKKDPSPQDPKAPEAPSTPKK